MCVSCFRIPYNHPGLELKRKGEKEKRRGEGKEVEEKVRKDDEEKLFSK